MIFLTLLTALGLSGVAAYYSVIGLAQIFPGSFWPVIIMGSILESSKLVTVSWLYRNWKECPILIKTYLSVAVTILMLITSMGIFGFLSKAHLEHSADNGPYVDKLAIIDEKIRTSKENIDANRKALKQMDEAVDQVMGRSQDEKGADKAVAIRKGQAKERTRLLSEITAEQKVVAQLSEERAPISTELRKVEADVGPIKYIAALAYGEATNDIIDKAVRLVILLIIVVFDPLAILLLIAYNMSIGENKKYDDVENFFKRAKENARQLDEDAKSYQGFSAQEVAQVIPEAVVQEEPKSRTLFAPVETVAEFVPAKPPEEKEHCPKCDTELMNAPGIGIFCPNKECDVVDNIDGVIWDFESDDREMVDYSKHAYLNQPFKHFENLKPMVYKPEEPAPDVETTVKVVEKQPDNTIKIKKENVIVIDDITGETIPGIAESESPYGKKLEPKYDYDEPYSFREKENKQ
jgi:hypothetical protein